MAAPVEDAAADIASMRVRGAAALALHAARALAGHVLRMAGPMAPDAVDAEVRSAGARLLAARPTAVSLRHALDWVAGPALAAPTLAEAQKAAADALASFEHAATQSREAVSKHGASLFQSKAPVTVLTHCNSSLALGCILAAHAAGSPVDVIATESRPFGQGLLTCRQLAAAGVPATLVVDSAVAHVLATQRIHAVLVGADTVSRDGDLVNKVGTHAVALLASEAKVPVYCAAPFYKFSRQPTGAVAIEERDPDEVMPARDLPAGVRVRNPVFDVTPAQRVLYVTEDGVRPAPDAVRAAHRRLPKEVFDA